MSNLYNKKKKKLKLAFAPKSVLLSVSLNVTTNSFNTKALKYTRRII